MNADILDFAKVVTERLALHERVYLWRRKRHLTQPEAAAVAGVTRYQWREWETGRVSVVPSRFVWSGVPAPWEWMELWRRRAGLSVTEAARLMDISHVTLLEREMGNKLWQETYQWWLTVKEGDDHA